MVKSTRRGRFEGVRCLVDRPAFRWVGWALLLLPNLLLLFIEGRFARGLVDDAQQLIVWSAAAMMAIGLMACGLTMVVMAYRGFWAQKRGVLVAAGLLAAVHGIRALPWVASSNWFVRQLAMLNLAWILVLMAGLGVVVLQFVVIRDQSTWLLGTTFLVYAWLLLAYVRWLGPPAFFQKVLVFNSQEGPHWFWATSICLVVWVVMLAPLAWLGHFVRLIFTEINQPMRGAGPTSMMEDKQKE